jgi:hypothetical protein
MKVRALLLSLALVLWTASASAVTFSVLDTVTSNGSPLNALDVGETVTIRLRIIDSTGVFGLGASAWDYDEAVIDYQTDSGQAVASINHATCIPAVGCFTGLTNSLTNPLTETEIGVSGNRVLFFNGVGLTATNTNVQDPGLDNVVGGGDAQVLLVFAAIAEGTTQIRLGTGYNGDGEVLAGGATNQDDNTTINITVPEPASLAAGMMAMVSVAGMVAVRRRF